MTYGSHRAVRAFAICGEAVMRNTEDKSAAVGSLWDAGVFTANLGSYKYPDKYVFRTGEVEKPVSYRNMRCTLLGLGLAVWQE